MASARGSHPKLTTKVRKTLVKLIGDGIPLKLAAEAAGVGERTLYRWIKEGKAAADASDLTWQLWQDIKTARAKGVAARVRRITAAAKKQWQADAWVLERTHPEHFGADRRELRELRKQVGLLTEHLAALRGSNDPARPPPQDPPGGPTPGPDAG